MFQLSTADNAMLSCELVRHRNNIFCTTWTDGFWVYLQLVQIVISMILLVLVFTIHAFQLPQDFQYSCLLENSIGNTNKVSYKLEGVEKVK